MDEPLLKPRHPWRPRFGLRALFALMTVVAIMSIAVAWYVHRPTFVGKLAIEDFGAIILAVGLDGEGRSDTVTVESISQKHIVPTKGPGTLTLRVPAWSKKRGKCLVEVSKTKGGRWIVVETIILPKRQDVIKKERIVNAN